MSIKKTPTAKKSVSFSDSESCSHTIQLNKLTQSGIHNLPVYIQKTWMTIPFHLFGLLYYFLKISNYDYKLVFWYLVPFQIFYLIFQLSRNTIYRNKQVEIKYSLLFISLGVSLLLGVVCMLVIILFGAPISELLEQTWFLSLHCCFLAYPMVYLVLNCNFKIEYFKKYFISIIIGCWISCCVIPLDWDREWQAWPIPLIVGAYLGAIIGYSLGVFI